MSDPLIRKCRKEAAWNTIKEFAYVIGKAIGIVIAICIGMCLFLYGMIYLIELTDGYDFTFILNIIMFTLIAIFFGIIILLGGFAVHEVYKENLNVCIERIKSENLMKSLSKPSALDIAKKEGLVELDE